MPTQTQPDIRAIYNQGIKLKEAGKIDEALQSFGRVILTEPKLAEAWWQAALLFLDADNFDEALRHAAKAVELRPEEPTVWATWADAIALSGFAKDEKHFLEQLKRSRLAPAFKLRLQDRFGAQRRSSVGSTGSAPRKRLDVLADLVAKGDHRAVERDALRLGREFPDCAVAFNALGMALAAQGRNEEAIQGFRASIKVDPFFAAAFYNMGVALHVLGKTAEAERMMRAAIARCPDFESALTAYGQLLLLDRRHAPALPYLERALKLNPKSPESLLVVGQVLNQMREGDAAVGILQDAVRYASPADRPAALVALAQAIARYGSAEESLRYAEEALALEPDNIAALGRKAMSLQILGRFDEARPLFLIAMEGDPTNGSYFRSYMTGTKAKPGDEIVERMIRLIDQPGLTPQSESNFGFAIAKGLEDQKDYTRAFPYLKRANDRMKELEPYDHKVRQDEIARMQDACRGIDWTGRRIEGASEAQPIFVTGMPRSGTTLIEQIISSHSRVTGGDEMDILPRTAMAVQNDAKQKPRRIDALSDAQIAQFGRNYLAEVAKRYPGSDIVSDKSITSYMYLGLTKLALPNARFIVVRRDPRDNLLSIYKNRFPDGAHTYAYDLRALAEHYATFVEMIDFWRAETPDWFTEVQYETLVANPEEESRRLIAACGLDWEEACLNFHRNERQVRTLSVYQVRQPISQGSVAAWQRYEKELAPMFEVLAERGLLPD